MFRFTKPVDPKDYQEISDPPPYGWETVDTRDYRKALLGTPTDTFIACLEWEKRELKRILDKKAA